MDMSPFFFGLYKLAKFAVYPFTWLIVLLGCLTVLVVSPVSPRRLRWIRVLAVSAFLLAFLFGNSVVADTLMGLLERQALPFDSSTAKRFDAIVVLGGVPNTSCVAVPAVIVKELLVVELNPAAVAVSP